MSRVRTAIRWCLTWVQDNPGLALAGFASLIVLATTFPLWGVTMNRAGDDLYHLANERQVALALAQGQNPFGPLDMVFGTPVLKFYQPLFYLTTGSLHALLGIPLVFLHNGLTVLCYAASPLALRWAYRAIGLPDAAAGLSALLTLASVAAFGNSYEAYFQAGIVTQSLGAVFFPLFIGRFALLLKERRGPVGAAALFGLTFVSHVIMAIYAVLAGALLFLVGRFPLRRLFFKLAAFSLLCCLLVGFWLVPFIGHQERHRPVPDLVLRTSTTIWFVGLSPGELNRQLFPGRLLDDARVLHADPQGPDDSLTDRLNIMGTLSVRTPFVTALVLLGFLLCLLRIHDLAHRFLVSGFAFSLLMLLSPDDVPWLAYIPFADRIQAFRCVYLIEFFAFGIAGAGLHIAVSAARRWVQHHRRTRTRERLRIAGYGIAGAATVLFLVQIGMLVNVHVDLRNMQAYEKLYDVAREAEPGFPFRVADKYKKSDRRRNAYMAYHGMRSICGHWGGVGPLVERKLCARLTSPTGSLDLARRMGIGYYLVGKEQDAQLRRFKDRDGKNPFRRLARGHGHYLFKEQRASYLWAAGRSALVVANDAQWFYLLNAWISRATTRRDKRPPVPVRAPTGERLPRELLELAEAVWVLDPSLLDPRDVAVLDALAGAGKPVLSSAPVDGLRAQLLDKERRSPIDRSLGPVVEPRARFRKRSARRNGPFDYQARLDEKRLVVLPELRVDGWRASVDGKAVPTFPAGPDLVGAVVPGGKHRVRFWWSTPTSELWLDIISALTWLSASGWLLVQRVRRRRRAR